MTLPIKLYYHPNCSKSQKVLHILETENLPFTAIDYVKNPLNLEELIQLSSHFPLETFVRSKEPAFTAKQLCFSREADILTAMLKEPTLMQRPILAYGHQAIIARSSESIRLFLKTITEHLT